MFTGAHATWRRQLRKFLSPSETYKPIRQQRRVRLQVEELETRALLSASTVTPDAAPAASSWTAQTNVSVTPSATTTFSGYTPQQLQQAYGLSSLLNPATGTKATNGAGQTIAIVDAYNDPNIASDLATFDQMYGLSPAKLSVVNQSGSSTNLPSADPTGGWELEESLDAEWAHAMAPGANIVLVEANSSSLSDLMTAVHTASTMASVNVVSLSWGGSEFAGETNYDSYFQPKSSTNPNGSNPGVTFVASAGDSSAYMGPEWPASSPDVLAVGGTTLKLNSSTNNISSESAWNTGFSWSYGYTGGGGGISSYESAPSFQSSIPVAQQYNARTSPDVAFDANPSTGVSIYDSYQEPGWGYVGGTSVGAPSWAGIVALADQQSAANGHGSLSTATVESTLYGVYNSSGEAKYTSTSGAYSSDFHDITSGSNGYSAAKGYDLATGLGSPNVSAIVSLLGGPSTSSTTGTTTPTSTPTGGTTGHPVGHPRVLSAASDGTSLGSSPVVSVVLATTTNAPVGTSTAGSSGSSAATNNLSVFTLAPIGTPQDSFVGAHGTPFDGMLNASASQGALVFGASGWKGSAGSWRLSSSGLSAALVNRVAGALASDSFGDEEGQPESGSSAEEAPILDAAAPAASADAGASAGDGGE